MLQHIWVCRNITSIYFDVWKEKRNDSQKRRRFVSTQSQDVKNTSFKPQCNVFTSVFRHQLYEITKLEIVEADGGERDQQTKWIISSTLNNSWIVSDMINWWFCLLAWGRSSFLKRLLRTSLNLHRSCSQVWMCSTECVTRWQKQEMLLSQLSPAGRSGGSDNTPLPRGACCGRRPLKAADRLQLLHTGGRQHELPAVLQYWHRVAGHSTACSSVSSVSFPPLPPCFLADILPSSSSPILSCMSHSSLQHSDPVVSFIASFYSSSSSFKFPLTASTSSSVILPVICSVLLSAQSSDTKPNQHKHDMILKLNMKKCEASALQYITTVCSLDWFVFSLLSLLFMLRDVFVLLLLLLLLTLGLLFLLPSTPQISL